MNMSNKLSKLSCLLIVFMAGIMCLFSLNFSNFTYAETYDMGTYEEFNKSLTSLVNEFGLYHEGEEYAISSDLVSEIDGEKYVSASALNLEGEDVALSSLDENFYEVSSDGDEIVVNEKKYTNRIIVYYEGNLEPYKTENYAEGLGYHIYQYSSREDTIDAYNYYSSLDYVKSVGYDDVVTASEISDPESTSSGYYSWGAEVIGVPDFMAYLNYTVDDFPTVYIAVLDSGINTQHFLFENRIASEYGRNFTGGAQDDFEDDFRHGSHVSGIITNLTKENVKIVPLKVLDNTGNGTVAMIISAINYVEELNSAHNLNIRFMNMSLGVEAEDGGIYNNYTLESLISRVYNNGKGITSVVAAGNKSRDTHTSSPANISDSFVVSALDEDLTLASYSNHGSTVDVSAPGTKILSAYKNSPTQMYEDSGTSMATPHVTAVFALLLSSPTYASYTNLQLEELVKDYAIDLGDEGTDRYYGAGCVSVADIGVSTVGEVEFIEDNSNERYSIITLSYPDATDYKIYYTVDESLPNSSSTLYTDPIVVSKTTKVTAIAYVVSEGVVLQKSALSSKTFYFNNEDLDSAFKISGTLYSGTIEEYTGSLTNLRINSYINGYYITSVSSFAFSGVELESITLPTSCTTISNHAFYAQTKLKEITGSYVESVGEYAFSNCTSLEIANLNRVQTISDYAFKDCSVLVGLNAGSSITQIGDYAFQGCLSLKELNIPDVQIVGENAFDNVTLDTLTMGGAVSSFGNMRNFHVGTIYAYLNSSFDNLYYEYADNVVDLSMRFLTTLPDRIVIKTSNTSTFSLDYYGAYISYDQSIFPFIQSGSYYTFTDGSQNYNLNNQISEINDNTYRATFSLSGLASNSYVFTMTLIDSYGNSIVSDSMEVLVINSEIEEHTLNFVAGRYQVYVDGQLASNPFTLYDGITYNIEVVPYDSYDITSVSANGDDQSESFSILVKDDLNLDIQVEEKRQFNVSFASSSGANVLVNGEETSEVIIDRGGSVEFTLELEDGFKLTSVTINGVEQELKTNFTLTNISTNFSVEIITTKEEFEVLVNYGNGGVVSSLGSMQNVSYGDSVEFTITPYEGYEISRVLVNGEEVMVENNTLTLSNITANQNVIVEFKALDEGDNLTNSVLIWFGVIAGIFVILAVSLIILNVSNKKQKNYKNHV